MPDVRFSEIHYDNASTDANERIEIEGPAGFDVTGWTIVLYNGSGGATYAASPAIPALSGTIPATCGDRGVLVFPAVGMQNGSPDGLALVDNHGTVIEFLSYEGTFAATNGPAMGMTSVDIVASEDGLADVLATDSLSRDSEGNWAKSSPTNTFGACNNITGTPPPVVASVTVTPATATIAGGATQTFSAQAFDASNAPISGTTFTWTSSDTTVATVTSAGVATAIANGVATITATAPNNVNGSATLTVSGTQPPPPPLHDTFVSELHYDNVGTDTGEAIEIEGPLGEDLRGSSIVLYDGNTTRMYNTTALAGTITASTSCAAGRGVFVVNYPVNGIQNGTLGAPFTPDGLALVDASGTVVQFLSYEGTFTATDGPAAGMTSVDIVAMEDPAPAAGMSLQRGEADGVWGLAANSFNSCNANVITPPPPPEKNITFSGRTATDPPLPVGFQAQEFATERAGSSTIATTFTWSSDTPDVATIDQNGVFTSVTQGTAVLRATAVDGTTGTLTLPTTVGTFSATADYAGQTEFGQPTAGGSDDDFIVTRPQFVTSYNRSKGTPNWVAFRLDITDYGTTVDRCNCFTMDPQLPKDFTQLTTADYTGAGAAAGFGIDRGHMARSFDRTPADLDNAQTYLLSNIVPQASDLNQGPWAILEDDLGDLAQAGNEVYVIDGPAGNAGTVKSEGKIVIPTTTWKVWIVMPHGKGLADIHTYADVESFGAVIMPNMAGVRNVPYATYKTTIDAVEELTGYDFFALLPDKVEDAIESNTTPPIAVVDGPYSGAEGSSISMSAAQSSDPVGTIATYAWDFGDGTTGTGASVSHTYATFGTFAVKMTITATDGATDDVTTSATVSDVAPVISQGIAAATLAPGATYTAAGSFADPGVDHFTATVDWGDGTAPATTDLSAQSFSFTHSFATSGNYTVSVTISDGQLSTSTQASVAITSASQTVQQAIALVDGLVSAGKLNRIAGVVVKLELSLAKAAFDAHQNAAGVVLVRAVVAEIDLLVRLHQLSATDAAPLRNLLSGLIASLS